MNVRRILLPAALLVALAACGRKGGPAPAGPAAGPERAVVTVEKLPAHAAPSGLSPVVRTLTRGTGLTVLDAREGFWRVQAPGGGDLWVEAGTFERDRDREAREKRAAAVAGFAPQPGRAMETAPILLAPAYGSAQWGEVEDGDDVEVVLHDHDFYGIRVAGARLAFVPARSIRLLPSPLPGAPEAPAPRRQIVPEVTSLGDVGVVGAVATPPATPAAASAPTPPGREGVLDALPVGAEPPTLTVKVEPNYPDAARRAGVGGEVVLKIVVGADGSVSKVDVVSGAPMGMTEAAVEAVSRWRYRPARIAGRPVAVAKVVRVRFASGR